MISSSVLGMFKLEDRIQKGDFFRCYGLIEKRTKVVLGPRLLDMMPDFQQK